MTAICSYVYGSDSVLANKSEASLAFLWYPSVSPIIPGRSQLMVRLPIDALQTRTRLINLLPKKPSLPLELALAIPDAIGRTLLLTRFSISPLLNTPSSKSLPPTPSSLLLTPFILAVPFASIVFSGLNLFSASPKLTTPAELKPGGWMMVDAWVPVVVPVMFLSMIGPVKGWNWGMKWNDEEAVMACMVFTSICFLGRAIYNFGWKKEQWTQMLGKKERKIKTA
jgi:hypothetical protein